jgi:hypothetical protein
MARPTLTALAKQRWRYGWWKAAVLAKYPRSLHVRQAIPMLMLIALTVLVVASMVNQSVVEPLLYLVYVYTAICAMSALHTLSTLSSVVGGLRTAVTTLVLAPVIYAVIHGLWAAGAVAGLVGNRRL